MGRSASPSGKSFEMLSSHNQYRRMPLAEAPCRHHTKAHAAFAGSGHASGIDPNHENLGTEFCRSYPQLTTFSTILVIQHYLPNKNRMRKTSLSGTSV